MKIIVTLLADFGKGRAFTEILSVKEKKGGLTNEI